MTFAPRIGQEIIIDGMSFKVAEHPAVPGMVFGQEGRQGVVYQLLAANDSKHALKVFKPRYRLPYLVMLARQLQDLAELPGLTVCRRTVLSANRNRALLQSYPDLACSVLIPWLEGPSDDSSI